MRRVEHVRQVGEVADGVGEEGRGDDAAERVEVGREGGDGLEVEDERDAGLVVAEGVVVDGDAGSGAGERLRNKVCIKFA